jgi:hypothetical protein
MQKRSGGCWSCLAGRRRARAMRAPAAAIVGRRSLEQWNPGPVRLLSWNARTSGAGARGHYCLHRRPRRRPRSGAAPPHEAVTSANPTRLSRLVQGRSLERPPIGVAVAIPMTARHCCFRLGRSVRPTAHTPPRTAPTVPTPSESHGPSLPPDDRYTEPRKRPSRGRS